MLKSVAARRVMRARTAAMRAGPWAEVSPREGIVEITPQEAPGLYLVGGRYGGRGEEDAALLDIGVVLPVGKHHHSEAVSRIQSQAANSPSQGSVKIPTQSAEFTVRGGEFTVTGKNHEIDAFSPTQICALHKFIGSNNINFSKFVHIFF